MPTDFRQWLQILCGFQKVHTFSAGLGLSAFQVRADFAQMSNFLRFASFFCHECSTIAAVSQSYCFIHFLLHRFFTSVSKVPSLPIWVSAVTATSLRASVFFFSFVRLCKFLWILSRPASFFSVLAFLLSLSVCCLSPVWVSIAIFYFPHRLATIFVCLSVLVVFVQDFGKTWQVCRSNSVPFTDLLSGFEIVEIFCQVLEGPPEYRGWYTSVHTYIQDLYTIYIYTLIYLFYIYIYIYTYT